MPEAEGKLDGSVKFYLAGQNSPAILKNKGAKAVVDLVSYYKKNQTKSSNTVECHAGVFVIGVTLKGTFAKVGR